jgi:non-homologous end joining protein Ku
LALAAKIINSQSGKFEPKKMPDQYAAAIREMILEPPSPANRKKNRQSRVQVSFRLPWPITAKTSSSRLWRVPLEK